MDCLISDTTVVVGIKIPIMRIGRKFKMFHIVPVSFIWDSQACKLDLKPQDVLISGRDLLRPGCDPFRDELCYVSPVLLSDDTWACLHQIISGGTVAEFKVKCKFLCTPATRMEIINVDFRTYVISNPTGNISLQCGQSDFLAHYSLHNQTGAIPVRIPCLCEARVGQDFRLQAPFPCAVSETDYFEIKNIIPASWIYTALLHLPPYFEQTYPTFVNVDTALNYNWQKKRTVENWKSTEIITVLGIMSLSCIVLFNCICNIRAYVKIRALTHKTGLLREQQGQTALEFNTYLSNRQPRQRLGCRFPFKCYPHAQRKREVML